MAPNWTVLQIDSSKGANWSRCLRTSGSRAWRKRFFSPSEASQSPWTPPYIHSLGAVQRPRASGSQKNTTNLVVFILVSPLAAMAW